MESQSRRRQSKARKESKRTQTQVGSRGVGPPGVPPELPPEIRDSLTSAMQQLLLKTHELSFEYSTLDCEELTNCPLAQKSRELFKVVKEMHKLMRKIAPAGRRAPGIV